MFDVMSSQWQNLLQNGRLIGRNVAGSGRGLPQVTVPAFALEELRKSTESFRAGCVLDEV